MVQFGFVGVVAVFVAFLVCVRSKELSESNLERPSRPERPEHPGKEDDGQGESRDDCTINLWYTIDNGGEVFWNGHLFEDNQDYRTALLLGGGNLELKEGRNLLAVKGENWGKGKTGGLLVDYTLMPSGTVTMVCVCICEM